MRFHCHLQSLYWHIERTHRSLFIADNERSAVQLVYMLSLHRTKDKTISLFVTINSLLVNVYYSKIVNTLQFAHFSLCAGARLFLMLPYVSKPKIVCYAGKFIF
jgi:hypothetical protein